MESTSEGKTTIKKDMSEKETKNESSHAFLYRKKLAVLGLAVLVVATGAIYARNKKKTLPQQNQKGGTISDSYRSQLPELEKKSESNTSGDLQNYGVALYATGNLSEAERVYRKQIGVDDKNAFAHNNLANVLRDGGKFDDAIVQYKRAIELSPKTTTSYVNLGSVYQYSLADIDRAIATYKQGIDSNPDSADLEVLLGIAYEQKGDVAEAQASFAKALKIQPENQAAKNALDRMNDVK